MNTQLKAIRQPAARIATGTLAAMLLAAFAQTGNASEPVGPAPHWTARIGTGQPFVANVDRPEDRAASSGSLNDASAAAHWTARIGTGRAVPESRSAPVTYSTGVVAPPAHWSAQIGTGHAASATNVQKPAERKVTADVSRRAQK